jgi:hypothetical protein
MKQRPNWQPKPVPHVPADWDEDVAYAIRALHAGTANDGQQKLAWAWLMYVSGVDDWPYRPNDVEGTNIMLGRQYVGRSMIKMLSEEVTTTLNKKRLEEAQAAADPFAEIRAPVETKKRRP